VDREMKGILLILCTPRRLFSGHSELLLRNKAVGACSCGCGHFLAGTLQYKYSQFTRCHVQDSNTVSVEHKPHTLPLISLSPCGDIWHTVWICVLEFCS
jgi:hypothetical protein